MEAFPLSQETYWKIKLIVIYLKSISQNLVKSLKWELPFMIWRVLSSLLEISFRNLTDKTKVAKELAIWELGTYPLMKKSISTWLLTEIDFL